MLFRLIPAYSGLFQYIPFRSVPFPCLVTPAVKRVKLIITKGTNGNLSITRCLGITNQTLSVRSTLISLILVFFGLFLPYFVVIPFRSGTFRYHFCSCRLIPESFGFIPESFLLVLSYSGLFRYIRFHFIPFLCLVTPWISVLILSHQIRWIGCNNIIYIILLRMFTSHLTPKIMPSSHLTDKGFL